MIRYIKKCLLCICCIPLAVLFAAPGYPEISHDYSGPVQYSDGRISVNAVGIPYLYLIEQICQKANLKIYMVDKVLPQSVTANFKNIPIEDALSRLLKGYNYAIVYQDTEHRSVYIGPYCRPLHANQALSASLNSYRMPAGSSEVFKEKVTSNSNQRDITQQDAAVPSYPSTSNPMSIEIRTNGSFTVTEDPLSETGVSTMYAYGNKLNKAMYAYGKKPDKEMYLSYQIEMLERQLESGMAQRRYEENCRVYDSRSVPNPEDSLAELKAQLYKIQYE